MVDELENIERFTLNSTIYRNDGIFFNDDKQRLLALIQNYFYIIIADIKYAFESNNIGVQSVNVDILTDGIWRMIHYIRTKF